MYKPPETTGLDQQTKNIVLFALIFSVLAAGIGLFVFFKPWNRSPSQTQMAPSTASTSAATAPTPAAPTTGSFLSQILSLFKSPFGGTGNRTSNYFSVPTGGSGQTNAGINSNLAPKTTPGQTPIYRVGTPYAQPATTTLTADEQRREYLKQLEGIGGEVQVTQQQLDLINLTLQSSPLRGLIWISSVYRSADPTNEYIVLSTSGAIPKLTNITNFIIKSLSSGQTVQIGQGVYLPVANTTNLLEDITIYPNQAIYVVSGHSPVGYSFRTNECTGYFSQFQTFVPSLPQNCPLLKNEPLPLPPNQLSDSCLDAVDNWPRCRIAVNPPVPTTDAQYDCQKFAVDHIGYQNCLLYHQQDAYFYDATQWRIYLNHSLPLWKTEREVIWLLDQNGKFISQYSY